MSGISRKELLAKDPVLPRVAAGDEVVWINPRRRPAGGALASLPLGMEDILDAEARLARFAPFIRLRFPETEPTCGLIESPLTPIPDMKAALEARHGIAIPETLLLKQDSHLAIAGSVKARGGIYEVLKHTEELALRHGLITLTDDYAKLASPEDRAFFSRFTVQVGSTVYMGDHASLISAIAGSESRHASARNRKNILAVFMRKPPSRFGRWGMPVENQNGGGVHFPCSSVQICCGMLPQISLCGFIIPYFFHFEQVYITFCAFPVFSRVKAPGRRY